MSAVRDGGQAFPIPEDESNHRVLGKTIRDSFAEAALMGFCANNNETIETEKAAEAAFKIADAMLDARQRPDKVGHAASMMRSALVKLNLMEELRPIWTKVHPIIIPALNAAEAAGVKEIKEEAGL